jgi:hypothetical protein
VLSTRRGLWERLRLVGSIGDCGCVPPSLSLSSPRCRSGGVRLDDLVFFLDLTTVANDEIIE